MFTARHVDDSYEDNPDDQALSALFDELTKADVEHGDVSLVDEESGWCISAHRDGRVVMVHLGSGGARHMIPVSKERTLEIWRRFKSGDIEGLMGEPWLPGYTERGD